MQLSGRSGTNVVEAERLADRTVASYPLRKVLLRIQAQPPQPVPRIVLFTIPLLGLWQGFRRRHPHDHRDRTRQIWDALREGRTSVRSHDRSLK